MLKIFVGALSEPIKCVCDLLPFVTRGHKIPKTVYYRLQFGPFGRSYWAAFQFLMNFVPRVLGRCISYHVRLNHPITRIYPFSR
ncbi:hypothetical protein KSS87_017486 [Heliosperma pusillum]|nr:hypothetical protein KSS87_017486 [Heliosperma pusillum]